MKRYAEIIGIITFSAIIYLFGGNTISSKSLLAAVSAGVLVTLVIRYIAYLGELEHQNKINGHKKTRL